MGEYQRQSGHFGEERNVLPLTRIQPQLLNSPPLSLVVLRTALSWLLHCVLINIIVKSRQHVSLVNNAEIRSRPAVYLYQKLVLKLQGVTAAEALW